MQRMSWFWVGLGVMVGLLLLTGVVFARPYTLRGSLIDPPVEAYPFELTSADGERARLGQFEGRLVLLFFGYTSCPDVCPTTLGEMKKVMADLGPRAPQVQVVYITVDPQRDTPEKLQNYLAAFDPAFIGLTGSPEELQPVWDAYGVYRQIRDEGSAAGYLVDHTARVYLIDRQGRLRLTYPFGTPLADIVQDLRYLLKES